MRIAYLAYKNMVSKPLNLILSVMLLTLSVSLVTFVFQLSTQLDDQLNKNIAPFDMVVGAKGSPLQLVLSSILHIDAPTGNIKQNDVKFIMNHPFVKTAIPVSYGDNYKGYRILGTEKKYLSHYNAEVLSGRLFNKPFEVVVGHNLQQKLNLKIGDTFVGSHGLIDSADDVHDDYPYTVVGIIKQTNTVIDQLIITPQESVWQSHNHDHDHEGHDHSNEEDHNHEHDKDHGHEDHDHGDKENHKHEHHDQEEHAHDDHNHGGEHGHDHHDHEGEHTHKDHQHNENLEITSLLVKFKNPLGMVQLPRFINENSNAQAALTGYEIQRLLNLFGSGVKTINGIAIAILFVSALSIFISLLKTIRERKKELALLRSYGMRTSKILGLVLLEGIFLTCIGFVLGWLLGRIGLWGVSQYLEVSNGYKLQWQAPDVFELIFFGIIFAITIIATLLASSSIFKLNVAKTLSDA